ncbi:uncharacterized protein BDW70DRAFT_140879 [Aspergillus foveolatus]|uniref:uncharacterized protein n=1 Tax=Aspergillus foveolatus TaxID=210207 RepID=UPI003CCE0C9D
MTSRCGRASPGSIPGGAIAFFSLDTLILWCCECLVFLVFYATSCKRLLLYTI